MPGFDWYVGWVVLLYNSIGSKIEKSYKGRLTITTKTFLFNKATIFSLINLYTYNHTRLRLVYVIVGYRWF